MENDQASSSDYDWLVCLPNTRFFERYDLFEYDSYIDFLLLLFILNICLDY